MRDDRTNLANVPAGVGYTVARGLVAYHPCRSVNGGYVQEEHANERREELHDSVFGNGC